MYVVTPGIGQLMLQHCWASVWLGVVGSAGIAYNLPSETAD